MDQVFEGQPEAEITLQGRKVARGRVKHDWGSRLQWQVKRDGEVVATPPARAEVEYEHPDATPGSYEIVLQMWKYEKYERGCKGQYLDISNKVTYTI